MFASSGPLEDFGKGSSHSGINAAPIIIALIILVLLALAGLGAAMWFAHRQVVEEEAELEGDRQQPDPQEIENVQRTIRRKAPGEPAGGFAP